MYSCVYSRMRLCMCMCACMCTSRRLCLSVPVLRRSPCLSAASPRRSPVGKAGIGDSAPTIPPRMSSTRRRGRIPRGPRQASAPCIRGRHRRLFGSLCCLRRCSSAFLHLLNLSFPPKLRCIVCQVEVSLVNLNNSTKRMRSVRRFLRLHLEFYLRLFSCSVTPMP